MKTTLRTVAMAMSLTIAATSARSADSPLGSPADAARRYGTNYSELVRAALPKVDTPTVTKLMSTVGKAAAAQKRLTITDARQLERVFGLRERGEANASGLVDAGEMVYRVDAESQRIYLVRRHGEARPVPRKEFEPQLAGIRAAHAELAERLGVPREEVMFTDFREVLSETDGHPELQKGVRGEIMSEGAVTTILRSVGGVLVEGSHARLSSMDARRIDLVDVRWPAMRVSAAAVKNGFRSPSDSVDSIVQRVSSTSKGQAVKVRMAVVLRPLPLGPRQRVIEYVPSLKVGVEPQSIRIDGGYRTDAGEIFYVDLVRGAPPFADVPVADTPESKRPSDRPTSKQ